MLYAAHSITTLCMCICRVKTYSICKVSQDNLLRIGGRRLTWHGSMSVFKYLCSIRWSIWNANYCFTTWRAMKPIHCLHQVSFAGWRLSLHMLDERQVASLSHVDRQTISNSPIVHVVGDYKEAPRGNPHRHSENMQTAQKDTSYTVSPCCPVM